MNEVEAGVVLSGLSCRLGINTNCIIIIVCQTAHWFPGKFLSLWRMDEVRTWPRMAKDQLVVRELA